jgi:NAD(P)-dependent dehydrogenase (short-subunit alcohol dehydrogenase family)
MMLICDVTDDASVRKMVDEVLNKAGRIDLLVNNAGVGLLGGAEESSTSQAQALFDVNVFGVLRVTNAVLPTMRRQGKGRIVNLSSVQGFIPAPYFALYSSTKHAVEGYSESLDHELRPFGIRVVLVEPAYTRTSFEENLGKPDQLLDIVCARWHECSRAESDGKRRCARSGRHDRFGGCDRSSSEEALCGGKNGAPGQFLAPFRPRIRIRQEPAKAARAAGLTPTSTSRVRSTHGS